MASKNNYFDREQREAELDEKRMDHFWKTHFHMMLYYAIDKASDSDLWKFLNSIPEDTSVETEPPEGRFWIFGPSTVNGFCVVVKSGPSGVTFPTGYALHRYDDLMRRHKLKTIRTIQEVVYEP